MDFEQTQESAGPATGTSEVPAGDGVVMDGGTSVGPVAGDGGALPGGLASSPAQQSAAGDAMSMWADDDGPQQCSQPVPLPPDLATCVDHVEMSVQELTARRDRIRAILPRVSPEDAHLLEDECRMIQGELTGRQATDNVDQRVSETISEAPNPYEAWNGTYNWDSKFHTYANQETHTVVTTVNIFTGADADTKARWRSAVEAKWSSQVHLDVALPTGQEGPPQSYSVRVRCNFVDDASQADYTVAAQTPGADEGGRSGQGGTTSMTGWGVNDTNDITHEFGHMLGNAEEYFTTDGTDHTHGGTTQGFRDTGAGIMNNPEGPTLETNYESIRQSAARTLGVEADRCTIRSS
jgi:hypothetical protein